MKKKKLLVFLQSGVGGAERVSVTIGKNLDRNKFDVSFCLIGDETDGLSIEGFIPPNYSIIRLSGIKGFRAVVRYWKVLREEKPDIVFSSIMHANTKLLACSLLLKKTKFVVRNNNYLYTLSKQQLLLLKIFFRFADAVIAQTQEMAFELVNRLRLPKEKVFVLQNPIDKQNIDEKKDFPSPFDGRSNPIYVACGRFHPVKGFDILIEAFALVLQRQPNAELHILGKITNECEPFYQKILSLSKELEISQKVFFDGFQTNPYVYIKNASCFVLSSRNEGLPNVLIESLYLGTPVAATKCIPVIERIVHDGQDGFLAETENVESLANAMYEASLLGRVESSYQAAKLDEFQRLFE